MASDIMRKYILELYEQCQPLLENPESISEAIEKLKLIIKVEPDFAKAHYSLGMAYILQDSPQKAKKHLKIAEKLGYTNEDTPSISSIADSKKIKQQEKLERDENIDGLIVAEGQGKEKTPELRSPKEQRSTRIVPEKNKLQFYFSRLRNYVRTNENMLIAGAAFVIPFLVRMIPELLTRYPVGYDTSHYIWAILNYPQVDKIPLFDNRFAPLTYLILFLINIPLPFHPIHTMKVLPSITFGLMGWALYRYGEARSNKWIGILMTLFFTFNLSSLRLSWDLHKQVTAFLFLILALPYLKPDMNRKQSLVFASLAASAVLAHQISVIPLGLIIFYRAIRERNWKLLAVIAIMALAVLPSIPRYLSPSNIPQINRDTIMESINFIMYTMPVPLILSLYHPFNEKARDYGMMASFLIATFAFSLVYIGGGFTFSGWRFAALLFIPLSFYASQTTYRLYTYFKKQILIIVVILLVVVAQVTPMLLGYNRKLVYKNMPLNFADNSFPYKAQHELEALILASEWCEENIPTDALLLTEDSMEDWVRIFSGKEVYKWWGTQYQDILEWAEEQDSEVYIIWWYINEPNIEIVKEAFTGRSNLKVMKLGE